MEWSAIAQLIDPKLIIVVAACWVLGFILKQTPKVANWSIVFYVTLFAIVFAVWMMGPTPEVILQGILCGAVSVYGYEFIKSLKGAQEESKETEYK
ncbi:hypothetical protein EHS13_03100 [Paenibacillus psychroresistens]|uniref:Holin n=1 Tax=Paenibacillus psychroresistens TaxID=1778678 RepID=A0A6B8REM1_9BACL|nr:phage holin family protein [Paenibacillus psychroresistens]QGQ93963.1 hypothetical protein EHS13_03100 [Paenibacillus psychroresistens]